MRVLIVNSLYSPNILGGAERSVQALAEGLTARGMHTAVLSSDEHDWDGDLNGVKCHYRRIKNLYWMKVAKERSSLKKPFWHALDSYNPFASRMVEAVIYQECPDVIHTNNIAGFSVAVWNAARKRKVPVVHTLRDYYLLCPKTTMFDNGRRCQGQCFSCSIYSRVRRALSHYVGAVVGVSRFTLDRHLDALLVHVAL